MQFWLNLPAAALFIALAIPYGLIAFLIYWITYRTRLRPAIHTLEGIVPPFIGTIGILFGLLTGFLANDVADRNRQAARAVLSEANALQDAFTLSIASASDMQGIRAALRQYARSALNDEWPHIADIGRDRKTEAAFEDLLRVVSDPSIAREAGQAVQSALIGAVSRVGVARSDRLTLGGDVTSGIKWLTVIILGVFTQVAIGLIHLQKPRAQVAALSLFSVSVVVALGLIALQEQPFSGPVQVSNWPIEEFLATGAPPAPATPPPASESPTAAAH
jgi:hypothetical protein